MYRRLTVLSLLCGLSMMPNLAVAADQQRDQDQMRVHQDEDIYGWPMMNQQERDQYREQLRVLTTEQEKERFRIQHRENMRERAKALGQTPPNPPDSFGTGRGSGPDFGPRTGTGSGKK